MMVQNAFCRLSTPKSHIFRICQHLSGANRLPYVGIHTSRLMKKGGDKKFDSSQTDKLYTYRSSDYNSYDTFMKGGSEVWEYQPYCIVVSLIVFMVYFFYLREENHIDKILERPLYDAVPGLEEQTMKARIRDCKRLNQDYSAYQKRYDEIQELKEKLARGVQK